MSGDGEEAVLSLQDVLEEDQQLEETANAVLGDSDDTQCTYSKVQCELNYKCTLNLCCMYIRTYVHIHVHVYLTIFCNTS